MSKESEQRKALEKCYNDIRMLEKKLQGAFLEVSNREKQILTLVDMIEAQKQLIAVMKKRRLWKRLRAWLGL